MKTNNTFCEECRKNVSYTVKEKKLEGEVKGVKYTYHGKEAHCDECDSEVYVAEIMDDNLKALYDVFRDKNEIVSLDIILNILKKYDIGKRPLSKLLGWGEHTYSRYCDGDMPTKQYSDELQKINENPIYYMNILDKNKDRLQSIKAFEKSKLATEKLINTDDDLDKKINLVSKYLVNKCGDITPLALQKALYYIQGFYYAFYEGFIFTEECEAWVHGPVYHDIYIKYKDYKFNPIDEVNCLDEDVFITSEKTIIDSVAKNICCYSGKILEQFTHSETPWLKARGDMNLYMSSNNIIQKNDIAEYFQQVKDKYNMINSNDIKAYTKKMFEQIA